MLGGMRCESYGVDLDIRLGETVKTTVLQLSINAHGVSHSQFQRAARQLLYQVRIYPVSA